MMGRGFRRGHATEEVEVKGFDAFELRLGDLMRGERATMGKSLLDVQRELKIKAAYIAAIENADPTAFDTPGFIAGYVRSYARYLNMDPDWAFDVFCRESGFTTSHGMSAAASSIKPTREERMLRQPGNDIFASPATPFIPAGEALFSGVEPRAVGSVMVLLALIGGLGFGGWTVLQEVQKVQFAPVEQTPNVVTEVDRLAGATMPAAEDGPQGYAPPDPDALARLYRPQALEVPVLVARDGPISTIDPGLTGALASAVAETPLPVVDRALNAAVDGALQAALGAAQPAAAPQGPEGLATLAEAVTGPEGPAIRVTEGPVPEIQLVAVRPAWVRVSAPDGAVIFEGILNGGDSFDVPVTEQPATLRVGESGALYFAVNGVHHGPVGERGRVTSNVALSVENLTGTYVVADIAQDADLAQIVNVAEVRPTQ